MHMPINFKSYKKSDFSRHSLFVMLLLPCFSSAEATSILLLGFFFVSLAISGLWINKRFFYLVVPFFLMLFIGSIGVFKYPLVDVVKDFWYVGKVIVAIGAGFVLARFLSNDFVGVLRTIILAGSIAAVLHLLEIAVNWNTGKSFFDLRVDYGISGFLITVIGSAFLVSIPRKMLNFSRTVYYLLVFISLTSVFVTFSRTYIVLFIVMLVVLSGWLKADLKSLIRVAVFFSIVLFLGAIMFQQPGPDGKSFSSKIVNSVDEVMIREYSEKKDINENWRGFESFRAYKDFQGGSVFEKIAGQGLGATVDLGLWMPLGGGEFRNISVLHNGYMYLLVKFGMIGFCVYIYFIFRLLIVRPLIHRGEMYFFSETIRVRSISALGLSLFLATFVIAGAFNKLTIMPLLIVLGLFSGLNFVNNKYQIGIENRLV